MSNPRTPFSRLPAEMLGYIFEECIEENKGDAESMDLGVSPWLLAQVCRFWYQTVKGTPSLWRKILVTDWSYTYWVINRNTSAPSPSSVDASNPGLVRSHSAIQVCLDSKDIGTALKRSNAASLEITLAFNGRSDASEDEPETAFYQGMYDMIFNEDVLPRISHLTLDSNSERPWMFDLWSGQELLGVSLSHGSLPNLIYLDIYSLMPLRVELETGEPLLQAILESATKLKRISTNKPSTPGALRYESWISSSYKDTISNLRELRIRHSKVLDQMLGGSLGLRELVLEGPMLEDAEHPDFAGSYHDIRTTAWPTPNTPAITFERLTRLHLILDDFSLLGQLKFPMLQELSLTPCYKNGSVIRKYPTGHPPVRPDFTLELARLHTLRVTSTNIAPVNRFIMPQLTTLHLTSTRLTQGRADADFASFASASMYLVKSGAGSHLHHAFFFDGVQNIYLDTAMSEKGVISTLQAFPNLKTLHIVPGKKMGKSLVQELCMTRHKYDMLLGLCRILKTVVFDCYSFREWGRPELKDARVGTAAPDGLQGLLAKLVESRKKWVKPLEQCTLIEMDGSKTEYV